MTFVDPANPTVQVDIERDIIRLSAHVDQLIDDMTRAAHDAAVADAAYDRAYYQTFLTADGPMEYRKAAARTRTADLYETKVITAAVLESVKEAGRNCRAQLDALRSVNVNHRYAIS